MADVMSEIKIKLLAGTTPADLIKSGFAKSTVYSVAKKLDSSVPGPGDELAELRQQRDAMKLKKEIAELEAAKEKLPDRVAALEAATEKLSTRVVVLEKKLGEELKLMERWARSGILSAVNLALRAAGDDDGRALHKATKLVEEMDKDYGIGKGK